jgi:hypothetical protein
MAKLQVELDVIDQGTKVLKDVGKEFNGLQSKIMAFAKAATAIFAGGVIVKQLTGMVQGAIDFGNNIKDASAKLGFSTTEFQKWSYVAKQSGSEINNLAKAFPILAKEAASSNQILGISTRESNGALRDSSKLFSDVLMKIAGIENPTERAAVALKTFGKSGKDVFAIASQGKDRISELIGETERYNLILSEQSVKKLDAAKNAQVRMNLAWKVASAELSVTLMPILVKVTDKVSGLAASWGFLLNSAGDEDKRKKLEDIGTQLREQKQIIDSLQGKTIPFGSYQLVDPRLTAATEKQKELLDQYHKLTKTPGAAPSQFDDLFNGKDKKQKGEKAFEIPGFSKLSIQMAMKAGDELDRLDKEKYDKAKQRYDEQQEYIKKGEREESEFLAKSRENRIKEEEEAARRETAIKWQVYNASWTMAEGLSRLGQMAVRESRAQAQEKKTILTGMAIADAAAAAVKGIYTVWNDDSINNVWYKIAMSAVVAADVIASAWAQINTIQSASFARGGSFTTNGPQTIIVGDNPGGRERVNVTPQSSPNYNGPRGGDGNLVLHIHDNSGSITQTLTREFRKGEGQELLSYIRALA